MILSLTTVKFLNSRENSRKRNNKEFFKAPARNIPLFSQSCFLSLLESFFTFLNPHKNPSQSPDKIMQILRKGEFLNIQRDPKILFAKSNTIL